MLAVDSASGKPAGGPGITKPGEVASFVDLANCIDTSKSMVLNANNADALKSVLGSGTGEALKSDADEQLLISVVFTQPVKLQSIGIAAPVEHAPKTVKLFVNAINVDFSDVEDLPPTQTLTFSAADAAPSQPPKLLQYVKYQNVTSLVVFIADNTADGEVSAVQRLTLTGIPVHTTNMNDLAKKG
mmetsp:Transcript_37141/g.61511  ORF Transcript_37141/g.61511 Transcript_37141/m.61511 type:complete len:186 (-) Transcript_37141:412-969(-)|eukprot:CAMPEP_0119316242 /NCGR_PEP_ID=MMETSP1333-20130426/39129_1 /TAXON_ID=418940 /ORGANISM="Scyphosphaera apsteinii, Strain RCC1455" /LENGTH=185 /DNA_ID=CAMNT_0007321839 /DNA_START=27 /DNA_END=584 /DNA_ORIENTATION=+